MRVCITAWSSLHGNDVNKFQPRVRLPERKHLKLMSRAVRLGVACALDALRARPDWQAIPPERRGLFVGARPEGQVEALRGALGASWRNGQVDLEQFGREGIPLVPPLWLVAGLSNNIVGFTSAYADLRGPVANRCEGRIGGLAAIVEAWRAVDEGRVDLAVAGGADCPIADPSRPRRAPADGAAFVVIERSERGAPVRGGGVARGRSALSEPDGPDYGAASGPLEVIAALRAGRARRIEVADAAAELTAWCELGVFQADDGASAARSPGR